MEWEKNKRAREDDGIEIESSSESNMGVKKRNAYGISLAKEKKKEMEEEDYLEAWDSHLAMGVFDFPWLKDGVMSKSDQCLDFEDNFSSSLEHQDTLFKHANGNLQLYKLLEPEMLLEKQKNEMKRHEA